ncbi:MAG: UDP-N-acetylglucosamine 2-epimerase (non-hydrolyzing) [Candidatus Woykebacteria bacterium]
MAWYNDANKFYKDLKIMKKILSIVGARPQFIKSAPLSKEIRKHFTEILVHTGQHYDQNMSPIFFEELSIAEPDYNLEIGSGGHGEQTGKMLIELEKVLIKEKPHMVLVYGDTNSTAAGALAAAKLHIPVAHVEAGLRSYNRTMPEEINRVLADHLSELLICPTETAVRNLKKEGITKGVYNAGDVMYDALIVNRKVAENKSKILETMNLRPKTYLFATIHRAENTDDKGNLKNIIEAFRQSKEIIVFPAHPRTQKMLKEYNLKLSSNLKIIEPVGYLDSLQLQTNSKKVLTDSGGVQKEAYILKVPCITLREETEWVETVDDGWNVLVGADKKKILRAIADLNPEDKQHTYFGTGNSASRITKILVDYFKVMSLSNHE